MCDCINKSGIYLFTWLYMYLYIRLVKCLCHEKILKNSINYMCVGPSIPVCSCIDKNCQVNCIDMWFIHTAYYVCVYIRSYTMHIDMNLISIMAIIILYINMYIL